MADVPRIAPGVSRPMPAVSPFLVKNAAQLIEPEPGSRNRHHLARLSGLMPVLRNTGQRISVSFKWTS